MQTFVYLSVTLLVANVKQSRQRSKVIKSILIPEIKIEIRQQGRGEAQHTAPTTHLPGSQHSCRTAQPQEQH